MIMKFHKIFSFCSMLLCMATAHFAYGAECEFRLKVSYKSGESGCLTELPFATSVSEKWNKPIANVINSNGYYLIAASQKCDLYEVFAVKSDSITGWAQNSLADSAEDYIKRCPVECGCKILIKNGLVSEDKKTALALTQQQGVAAANLSSVPQKPATITAEQTSQPDLIKNKRDQNEAFERISSELKKLREENSLILRERQELEQLRQSQASTNNTNTRVNPVSISSRRALVIGNDSYQSIPKLVNAREDAKTIAAELASVGYSVTLKFDLGEKGLKSTLRTFRNQIEPGDEVAFFYAGHGVQLDNTNFLLPIDVSGESEEQIRDEAIPLQRLLDDASSKKAKFTLAVIDACRDNPFKTMGRNIGGTRGLAPTSAATGQMVIFSAGAGQQALDKLGPSDKSKNGLFTRVFAKQIQTPGVTVDRLLRNVRVDVVNMAKSVGHEQTPAIYDQAVGDFYFRK